LATTHLKAGCW
jgi:hypothetical protein